MIKAILLAAGESKRLKSENKLIKKFKNKALINHPLHALFKSKIDKIVIVLGYENKEVRKVIKKNKKNIFVFNKKLILGTWQGLYLFEHRLENQTRILSHHLIGD